MKICLPSNKINYDWIHLLNSYKKYVNKTMTVLEIGASAPERTKELSLLCRKLIGVEYVNERKPDDFNNVEYITGDWQNLSEVINPESIDIAVASHVIEHVPDDLKAINELYKVLKPDGIGFINTPNRKRFVRSVIEIFTGERRFPYWEHVREYTEEDLLNLLGSSLFKKFYIEPVVFGIHGCPFYFYFEKCPDILRKFANFWEIHLVKNNNG